ncbi:MAG: type II secretion system F family protein [Alphaproteobacteria bacterium]
MTFVLLFFGFLTVFLLVLYGLGVIRIIPKSLKAMEGKQSALKKQGAKAHASLITAKLRTLHTDTGDHVTMKKRLNDKLFASGIQMSFDQFLALTLPIAALMAFGLFQGASLSLPMAIPLALAIWLMMVNIYLKRKQQKRRDLFEKDFVDVVATIARAISVGASLQESFRIVSEEFPGPIQDEFNRMRQDILFGRTPQQAITQAGSRLQLQDFDYFALSVITQIESGGNLGKSMDSLREMILNRQVLLRQLKIKTASAKFQVRFFIGMPIVVSILMYFVDRQNVMYFVGPEGKDMGRMLVIWMVLGILLVRHMNKKALDS